MTPACQSSFITNNFEEVLILGSLEERGLPRHLTQVAALTVEFDTLQDDSGLRGLALLRMGDSDNCPVIVGADGGNVSFVRNIIFIEREHIKCLQ